MFKSIIDSLIFSIKEVLGQKYLGYYKSPDDNTGINTSIDYQFFIQENERKEKTAEYDRQTKLYTDERYFDLIIQYRSNKRDEDLENKILNLLLKKYDKVTYITDRKYLFKKLTNTELKTEIQINLFTFAVTTRTIKP
ncbi:MAG TPA: hypothetical protein PK210_04960 [Bacteroidia bacterium]|nr:hypothetical protein [Bacteroidia bacterium]